MTKQINEARDLDIYINQADLEVLRHFASLPKKAGSPSIRSISSALSMSDSTVRRSLRRLSEENLVKVRACYLPNGGQCENRYSVASRGTTLLKYLDGLAALEEKAMRSA